MKKIFLIILSMYLLTFIVGCEKGSEEKPVSTMQDKTNISEIVETIITETEEEFSKAVESEENETQGKILVQLKPKLQRQKK